MDLYGVGTVLYEALCGAPAFEPEVPAAERLTPGTARQERRPHELALQLLDPDPSRRPDLDAAVRELARICAEGGMAFRPDWVR